MSSEYRHFCYVNELIVSGLIYWNTYLGAIRFIYSYTLSLIVGRSVFCFIGLGLIIYFPLIGTHLILSGLGIMGAP